MTVNNPNDLEVENDKAPDTPAINAGEIGGFMPTASELDADNEGPENQHTANDPEAPYGRKKDGTPAKQRGRRKAPTEAQFDRLDSVTPAGPRVTRPVTTAASPTIAVDYRTLGETAANLWFNVPQIIFGEDWQPEKHEVEPIAKGFTDYFKSQEITSINPTLALCLVLGSYTVARMNKPTVKSRLTGVAQWIKAKLPFNR